MISPAREPVASSDAADTVHLGYFTRSIVTRVGHERGLFARARLAVQEHPCQSSPSQFKSLRRGELDIAITSPDNVAAYRLTDANPLHTQFDVRILLGVDGGLGLSIVSGPTITTLAELRGRTVAVDVASSGFAMALFAVLEAVNLRASRDYQLLELGSTPNRARALLVGDCDATLLYAGHDLTAVGAGCHRLARVSQTLHPYLGAVLASTGDWLDSHQSVAQRFIGAWCAATSVILSAAERPYVQALVGEVMGVTGQAAADAYETATSAREGLVPDGAVATAALRSVLSARARYSEAGSTLDLSDDSLAASGLVDLGSLTASARNTPALP